MSSSKDAFPKPLGFAPESRRGPLLGPILFVIFIEDIPDCLLCIGPCRCFQIFQANSIKVIDSIYHCVSYQLSTIDSSSFYQHHTLLILVFNYQMINSFSFYPLQYSTRICYNYVDSQLSTRPPSTPN